MKSLCSTLLTLLLIFCGLQGASGEELLTIEKCARISIENSFRLKTYDSKVQQNEAKVKETMAQNNPSVGLAGTSTYQRPEMAFSIALPGMTPLQSVIAPEWYHTYNIAVNKLITSFGKVEAAAKVTQIGDLQYRTQQRMDQETLIFDVVKGYYTVIQAEQFVAIARAQEKLWQDQAMVSEAMYRRGTVAKYDLLRVQVSLAEAHDRVITTKKDLDVTRGNLRTLMGLPLGTPAQQVMDCSFWGADEKARMALPLEHWREQAMKHSPAIDLCRVARLQGVCALELARLDMAPSLSFQSAYYRLTQSMTSEDWAWKNTVALSIPISDGGQKSAKITQARELIDQADLNIRDTERTVLWNVEKAYLDLHELFPRIKTAEEQYASSQEAFRVAKVRYRAGLGTIVELTDAESSLIKSDVNLKQIYCAYHIQMAALSYASGILYDDIFMWRKSQ